MKTHSILILGVSALLSGCATPSNLERIATIQNRAEALYAYGGAATFPVTSDLAQISVYAPLQRKHEFVTVPEARERPAPVAPGERRRLPEAASNEQVAKAQESVAQTKGQPSELTQRTDAQKETVVTQAAQQVEKAQAGDVKQQSLAADTQVSEHQPTFRATASKERVNVGQKFELTMEFKNSTPVDLAAVQLTDPIDPRLKLFEKAIKVKPNVRHNVSVGNGRVVVRFSKEIRRGKRVRVTIPVMFPSASAAAAQ
jgi:uncharacterized repeat protein (TIGR01451 family)